LVARIFLYNALLLCRLFEEVGELGLAARPAQKAEFGKLLMQGTREFARCVPFALGGGLF